MKYINYVLYAYILLVTVLPIWSEYILADLPYKTSQEKVTEHNLYHLHLHQMTICHQVLKVLCYYNAQINQQQPGSTDNKTDIIKWKSRSVLKTHFIHRIYQSTLLHLITRKS